MTKKPKTTEAQAAELEPAEAVQAEPETSAAEAAPAELEADAPAAEAEAEPAADGIDDGGIEAEEVADDPEPTEAAADPDQLGGDADQEGNQPEAQQAQGDPGAEAVDGDQSGTDAAPDPQPDQVQPDAPEPTADQLSGFAQLIAEKLTWHRGELVEQLIRLAGLKIDRSLDGTRVEMAGIAVSVADIGPTGEYRALDKWANAARRKVLELQAVPHG